MDRDQYSAEERYYAQERYYAEERYPASGRQRPADDDYPRPNKPSRTPQIVIALCAVVALLVAGGAYEVTKRPADSVKAAGMPTQSVSASPVGTAAAAPKDMPPASLGTNWKQTFSTTFSGSRLDTSIWGTCYPWAAQSGCTNSGNSNEYQWYMPSQDQVQDGVLHLVAERAPIMGGAKEYPYRSGLVTTFPGYRFQYGYIEAVAKLPTATGLWSALWLAAANEQWPPEIDIIERWDASPQYWQYYHPADAPRERSVVNNEPDPTGWHKFGVYWDKSKIVWYLDGHPVMQAVRNVPQQPMYFLANVAVDSQEATLASGNSMDIKSVKVWQRG